MAAIMKIPFTRYEIRSSEKRPRPDDWSDFWYGNQGISSKSGQDITEDTALTYSAVWACVKVISEDLASLPLHVYVRNGKRKERAPEHPVYSLLHDQPNPEMTAMQFREALQAHLLLWGNAYAQIQRNLRGQPRYLWPLHPGQMTLKRTESNELFYEYRLQGGEINIFQPDEILHIAGLGFNGLQGYSVIRYQCEAIALGLSAQDRQATDNKNGSRLQLAFVHPAPKAPNEEGRKAFREAIRKEYSGANGQSIGVFWEGMKPEKIGMSLEDAQFIERLKLGVLDICRIFRVPPHKIMDLERATFSNIEQQSISYVIDAVRPWAVRWEQSINNKLLDAPYFCEHLIDALMRGDISSRYAAYAVGRQWGWLSINDIRGLENMNPIEKGGDIYLSPMNMVPAEQVGQIPEEAPVTEEEKEEAARAIRQLRLIRRN
jgi:HK97 family phage portal protein